MDAAPVERPLVVAQPGDLPPAVGEPAEVVVRGLDLPPYPMDPIPPSCCKLSENMVIRYEYRPGLTLGGTSLAFNSEGFRDREHSIEKPEGTFRVIAIGDSAPVSTSAHTVPLPSSSFA